MGSWFELRDADGAGRIGELELPRREQTVTTPALLPVINPNIRTIEPSALRTEFGAEILITNSYIIHSNTELREQALEHGLHEMLGFDGAIMTDSGSFQLAEYGEISVSTEEILRFQHKIGSDIGTPVDIPTPPDVEQDRANTELSTTIDRLATAQEVETGEMLVSAPVQGSTHPQLRRKAGEQIGKMDPDIVPIGAVVPLLEQYRYDDMIDIVVAAKQGLGPAKPVHLFGAGHPMMFALATAAGCDLFDSAAYALYARDDRYLTVNGTKHLEDLTWLPCSCPVCVCQTPEELKELNETAREQELARHNLYVSFAEIRRIRQAIRQGRLFELVERRARAHPAVLDGYRALLEHQDWLEAFDPVSKDPFFYLSTESNRRPEVKRHHQRLKRLDPGEELLLTVADDHDEYESCWSVRPPFGPIPPALSQVYPLTAEVPSRTDTAAYNSAVRGINYLAEAHPDTAITFAHDGWPKTVISNLNHDIDIVNLP